MILNTSQTVSSRFHFQTLFYLNSNIFFHKILICSGQTNFNNKEALVVQTYSITHKKKTVKARGKRNNGVSKLIIHLSYPPGERYYLAANSVSACRQFESQPTSTLKPVFLFIGHPARPCR